MKTKQGKIQIDVSLVKKNFVHLFFCQNFEKC